MNLFINAISKNAHLILFDDKRNISDKFSFEIKGNESSLLLPKIHKFLEKNKLNYLNLKNLVVVNGPWSFTGVRTIVLVANSIAFTTPCNITSIGYFQLFSDYPIVKTSSKRDSFFQKNSFSPIEILQNWDIQNYLKENNISIVYGEADINTIQFIEKIDYSAIIKRVIFQKNKKIDPLYIKKPNIC